jgi:hypothetical protein
MKTNAKYLSFLSAAIIVGAVGCVVAPNQATSLQSSTATVSSIAAMNQLPSGWTKFDPSLHKTQSGIQIAHSVSPDMASNGVERRVSLVFSGVTASDAKVSLSLTKGLSLVSGATEWTLPAGNTLSQVNLVVKGNSSDAGNLQYVNVFAGQNNVTNAMAVEVKIEGNIQNTKPANGQITTDAMGRKLLIMSSDK